MVIYLSCTGNKKITLNKVKSLKYTALHGITYMGNGKYCLDAFNDDSKSSGFIIIDNSGDPLFVYSDQKQYLESVEFVLSGEKIKANSIFPIYTYLFNQNIRHISAKNENYSFSHS